MSENDALQGLSCPRCGGMVPIPEGEAIVACPFCDLRSVVSGERGVRRYQVPTQITREQAEAVFKRFLSGNLAIARNAASRAQISEVLLVHLPFWAVWGQVATWLFGYRRVKNGDHYSNIPKEERVTETMSWNAAACDVGEFGVTQISLDGRPLEAFNADNLHRSGLVFEPLGSAEEMRKAAWAAFEERSRGRTNLSHVSQSFMRVIRPRLGLVYYPLWVVRYLYRGRSFQVVVDGYSGEALYGKAPGNSWYRAAALVGGMALGAILTVDVPALIINSSDEAGMGIIISAAIGIGLMYAAWRTFRHGEHYEYRRHKSGSGIPAIISTAVKDVDGANININDVIRLLER